MSRRALPRLSIVIPAFNEAARIGPCLQAAAGFLDAREPGGELLVVDDGSADATAQIVEHAALAEPRLRLLRLDGHRGKGAAVRCGMLAARGEEVLFSDVDLSTPLDEIDKLRAVLGNGVHVAIASRVLPGASIEVLPPWSRRLASPLQRLLVRCLIGLPYGDTQCGFKLFRRDAARAIFSRSRIDGFAFDIEILHLARLLGMRVSPVAVRWNHDPDSRVRLVRHSLGVVRDLVRIRWMHRSSPRAGD